MSTPARKQARLDCFLLPKKNADNDNPVSIDGASAAGSDTITAITPATLNIPITCPTVTDTGPILDAAAAARVDIAYVQELRLSKRLTLTEKVRFHKCVLQVPPDYKLPVEETTKQKYYYLRHHHLTGGGNAHYDYFYFSPQLQGVLCLACLLYAPEKVGVGNQSKLGVLVETPLNKFKKISEIYNNHLFHTKYHQNAVQELKQVEAQETTAAGDISRQLKTQLDEEISNNRYLFRAVLHEIDFFARTNNSLRGSDEKSGRLEVPPDESSIDFTQGNLRAALQKRCVFDQKLASIVSTCSRNATFLSPEVQNRMICCAATVILREVTAPVHNSGPFSIIADGTSDISRCEQMSLTLRYENNGNIDEVFVGYVPMKEQNAEAIATAIKIKLLELGLNLHNIVGQGYDGASVMSGRENGVQALIRRDCPNALFIHCQSHCLNLSIRSSSNVREVQAVHMTIAEVCSHFAHSSVRTFQLADCVQKKKNAGEINTSKTRPKTYCPTRFVEGAQTVFTFIELYPALLEYFEQRREINIVNTLTDPVFVVSLHLLKAVIGETKGLSTQLQAKAIDLVNATVEVERVIQRLTEWRSDDGDVKYSEIFAAAVQMYGDDIPKPRVNKRQTHRSNVPADTAFQYYRRAVWYPMLDQTIEDLHTRFSESSKVAMNIAQLLPEHCNDANALDCAVAAFQKYEDHLASTSTDACKAEFERWQHWCSRLNREQRSSSTVSAALTLCDETLFPNMRKIFKIFATLPVTTCTAERSFSVLRLIKNHLRSTMGNDRLNGLALLSIHKNVKLDYDSVVAEYTRKFNTRVRLTE
jgi:hypothetical protein